MRLPNHEACTGCGSCAAVCPKGCIQMTADDEGFFYPQIDQDQCVDCKKCESACAVLHPPKVGDTAQIHAAQNMDSVIRQESSSGGVFTALAELFIRKGGAVCAAVYNEDFSVEHKIAFTVEEIAPMRGAKYVQSYAGHLFQQLKQLLANGRPLMFVGTPCQCAGLRAYLGQEHENLLLVDMICHGVPAPSVWKAYLARRRALDAEGSEIAAINLRDKSTGWSKYAYSVKFQYTDGRVYSVQQGQDPYMRGFVGDLYLRPSCSHCSFKGINRCSDLTLADCWGIWDSHPAFDDNKGTSLVLLQSPKGRTMWQRVSDQFQCVTLSAEAVAQCNPSAVTSATPHDLREEFFARLRAGEPVDELIWAVLLPPTPPRQGIIKRVLNRILSRH